MESLEKNENDYVTQYHGSGWMTLMGSMKKELWSEKEYGLQNYVEWLMQKLGQKVITAYREKC